MQNKGGQTTIPLSVYNRTMSELKPGKKNWSAKRETNMHQGLNH